MPMLRKDIVSVVHSEKLNWFQDLGDWIILDTLVSFKKQIIGFH
jgi:hypothetical protein